MTFDNFDFHPDVRKGIRIAGFKEPSPIQEEVIPLIIEGHDMVGQAHTGTGKTAAFGLPIIDMLARKEIERALIIVPTRELATQVSDEIYHLGRFAGIRTLEVYGGVGYGRQIALIHKGTQVIVATPGRLKDLYRKGKIDVLSPEVVVLDEADEMLDMGFLDDIKEIFDFIPQNRQTLLFSATMPEPIKQLADQILFEPRFISVVGEEATTNNVIDQRYYVINENQRDEAIIKLLETEVYNKCLIFCRMKREVDRVAELLQGYRLRAAGLHGDMEQIDRDATIRSFRRNETRILVATDVAARGLDVKDVTHVINYHIPFDPQSYVHRIGRTGRAGRTGQAITLVSTEEFRELMRIRKEVGAEMRLETMTGEGGVDSSTIAFVLEALEETAIHPEIDRVLAALAHLDQTTFIKKALSYMVSQVQTGMGGQIGFDQAYVDDMIESYQSEVQQSNTGKNKKRKRRR